MGKYFLGNFRYHVEGELWDFKQLDVLANCLFYF